jgi:shikimate dehydrogenase
VKIYGLVGHPVGHSASPALHNWGFARHRLSAVYEAWDVAPEDLPAWVEAMRRLPLEGASVTIPHKESILPLLDELMPGARRVGAVNTLVRRGNALVGENTDLAGSLHVLRGGVPAAALVLGAGGVARAVLAGLEQTGISEILVAARSLEKAAPLARAFPCRLIPWEERAAAFGHFHAGDILVVNATPLGMRGPLAGHSPLAADAWPPSSTGTACDTVDTPRLTPFLRQARARGWRTVDGLAFFLAQGLVQFRLWTGLELPFDEAERLVEGILSAQESPLRSTDPLLRPIGNNVGSAEGKAFSPPRRRGRR